jgi:predicted DNA-binding transcriptional regulator YafY
VRASRLLRILLLLQNRGRVNTAQLASELEVARRTIMRDIDALTEAGLPIIVHRGNRGGIELGFNYRSRLVGLDAEEAEALGIILSGSNSMLAQLNMSSAAHRARDKLVESLPEVVRRRVQDSQRRFRFADVPKFKADPRLAAMAVAIRNSTIVQIHSSTRASKYIHPIAMCLDSSGYTIIDAQNPELPIPMSKWGDINISTRRFFSAPKSKMK